MRTVTSLTGPSSRAIMILALCLLMLIQSLAFFPDPMAGAQGAPSSRIIVVSNQTSIPLAMGTPSTGLGPFTGILVNRMGVHVTGQVVDGNYTPLWQPGAVGNRGLGDARVHWSFGAEADRAHSVTADGTGRFSLFITPEVEAPATASLRFWFDGRSDTVYGIPIYPPAEVVYDVLISESAALTVRPAQTRVMAGDTMLVRGSMAGPDGSPAAGEGLIAYVDGQPAVANPHAGWFVDNVMLYPLATGFEDGLDGFSAGDRGSWSSGIPSAGPKAGSSSIKCAGAAMGGEYAYDADGWLVSPTVDLSGTDQAALLFDSWSEVANGDEIVMELSNDGGLTWPVRVAVDSGATWTTVDIPIGVFTGTAYGTVNFVHSPDVRFRFRLIGHTMPVTTATDGSYEFLYPVPKDKAAGPAVITVEHPSSSKFASTAATATVDIARWTNIETVGPDAAYRGIPAEARASLMDAGGSLLTTFFQGQQVSKPTVKAWLRQGDKETYLGESAIDKDGYSSIGIETGRSNPLGPAQVRFYFAGNEFYGPAEAIRDMVFKAHTEVVITSPRTASLVAEDSLEVTGNVMVVALESSSGAAQDPIAKNDVQVFLDGFMIGTTATDDQGLYTFTYNVKGVDLGSAIIRVAFPGDKVYEPSDATVDLSILSDTIIEATPKTVFKGDTAVIDGTLRSAQGGVQGIVEVSVGGPVYTKVATAVSGRFSIEYKVPWTTEPGLVPVTLTYMGTKTFRPTTTRVDFTVMANTMIQVPKDPISVHRGAAATLRGRLVEVWDGQPGDPVVGADIHLKTPDRSLYSALTNPDGNFTYIYTQSSMLPVGDTTVLVTYSSDYWQGSSANINLRITSATSMAFAELGPTPATVGSQTRVMVVLTDDNGAPVTGRNVKVVSVQPGAETVLYEGLTDTAGALTFSTTMNDTGARTLVARFEGDGYYEASEASQYLYVGPAPTTATPYQRQPTIVIGGSLSLILLLSVALTENGKYFLFKLVLVPMYSKLKKEDVLDHFVRGQIYGLIRVSPGAHYNLIKQRLDLTNGVLSYHLSTLEREGYILSEMDGIYKRFYPNHVKFEVDYPIFLSKLQERIVDFIKSKPGITQKEVAKELDLSTSTVNDNIQVLKQANILDLRRDGKRTRCYLVEA
jgi:DNA-binding transcriptional ArsR family regulator